MKSTATPETTMTHTVWRIDYRIPVTGRVVATTFIRVPVHGKGEEFNEAAIVRARIEGHHGRVIPTWTRAH